MYPVCVAWNAVQMRDENSCLFGKPEIKAVIKPVLIWALTVILLLPSSATHAGGKLRILTEDYPPFGYYENGHFTGLGVEIVTAMARYLREDLDIEVLPWKRAYRMALAEPNVALFAMTRLKERENLFQWVGPLITTTEYLWAHKNSARTVKSLEGAKKVSSILVQSGGASELRMKGLGFTNLTRVPNIQQQIQLLIRRRGDLINVVDITVFYQLRKMGLPANEIVPIVSTGKAQLYLAFSNNTDILIVNKWQRALQAITDTGQYEKIVRKYVPEKQLQ